MCEPLHNSETWIRTKEYWWPNQLIILWVSILVRSFGCLENWKCFWKRTPSQGLAAEKKMLTDTTARTRDAKETRKYTQIHTKPYIIEKHEWISTVQLQKCICHYLSSREDLGFEFCLSQDFSRLSHTNDLNLALGAGIAQLVVLGLAVHSVAGSILLWGLFPVEGIFPLELHGFKLHSPQNSFGWEYKPRSSLCTHAFHRTDSKDPDVHVLDGWMPATKTHPARTIHEDGMWLP